ncbi:hypothetical protein BG006_005701 [Podila minutissima]|uniref:F-box domain-containing protein n=1 Tax=Podila minutissima TaxID=64525 RepID=A0A9P5SK23_9FUNG|nr:hypothetical protein BG006_005701 [Podila minutissima]
MTTPSPTTVFDIPLIQDRITHHLAVRDLCNCTRVSRSWNKTFKPYLWRVINIRRRSNLDKFNSRETQAQLRQNTCHVQEVNSNFAEIWSYFRTCPLPNLTIIRSQCFKIWQANRAPNKYLHRIIALMDTSPNLHTLELQYFNYKAIEDSIFQAIQRHNSLRHIRILRIDNVGFSKLEQVLWAMYRLESATLAISGCNDGAGWQPRLTGRERVSELTNTPNPVCTLRALDWSAGELFNNSPQMFLQFLKSCPNLERLAPPLFHPENTYDQLGGIIASHLRHLQELDMHKVEMSGSVMARTIRACRGLRTFVSARQQRDMAVVVDALLRHRETLEVLDLVNSNMSGSCLHTLLCACPNLQKVLAMATKRDKIYESIGDPVLAGKEMEEASEGSAWVCTNIKSLAVRYEHGPDSGQRLGFDNGALGVGDEKRSTTILPGVLVRELSRLVQLEELRLGRVTFRVPHTSYGSLSMTTWTEHRNPGQWPTLKEGHRTVAAMLYALSGLKKLHTLELRNLKEFVGEHVLEEVSKQWKGVKIQKS